MSKQYLLPCSCGNQIVVEPTQAGETLSCSCGQQLVAPTLRQMRTLAPAQPTSAQRPSRAAHPAPRGRFRGLGFGISFLVLILALGIAAIVGLIRHNIDATVTEEVFRERGDQIIDAMAPAETLEFFREIVDLGLEQESLPFYEVNRIYRLRLLWVISACLAVAAVAGIFCVVFVIRSLRSDRETA